MSDREKHRPEMGMVYDGSVQIVAMHGAWVTFFDGCKGFLPVAEISDALITRATDVLNSGDAVRVKAIAMDTNGQFPLSLKNVPQAAAIEARIEAATAKARSSRVAAEESSAQAVRDGAAPDAGTGVAVPRSRESIRNDGSSGGGGTYQRKYATAGGVASFLGFVGWLEVCAGVILVVVGVSGIAQAFGPFGSLGILAVIPGIMVVAFGLFQVSAAQIVSATLDSANHTGEMLEILRSRNGPKVFAGDRP